MRRARKPRREDLEKAAKHSLRMMISMADLGLGVAVLGDDNELTSDWFTGALGENEIRRIRNQLLQEVRQGCWPNYALRTGQKGKLVAVRLDARDLTTYKACFWREGEVYINGGGQITMLYRHEPNMPIGPYTVDLGGENIEVEVIGNRGSVIGPGSVDPRTGQRYELHGPGLDETVMAQRLHFPPYLTVRINLEIFSQQAPQHRSLLSRWSAMLPRVPV